MPAWGYGELRAFLGELEQTAEGDDGRERALTVLTLLMDRRCPLGAMKRSLLSVLDACLERVVEALRQAPSPRYALCGCGERADVSGLDVTLVFDARGFTSEGDAALAGARGRLPAGCPPVHRRQLPRPMLHR